MAGYTVSSVTSGKYARQVTVAASGPQGARGPQGEQGLPGAAGGLSARFKFLNSHSATDPGVGYLAFDSATFMTASTLYISNKDSQTDSQSGLLDIVVSSTNSVKSILTLQKVSDPRKFSRFSVSSGTDNGNWRDYQIEYLDGTNLSWAYNDLIELIVSPFGDAGTVGPAGAAGQGVPSGGAIGQILRKTSESDYATEWVDPAAIESVAVSELTDVNLTNLTDGQVLVYNSSLGVWSPISPQELPQSVSGLSGTLEGGSATTF